MGHSWESTRCLCPEWVWYGDANLWHWGTDSNQREANPRPLWVVSPHIKRCSLPRTSAAAACLENVKCCHYQVQQKSTLLPDPPYRSPAAIRWEADKGNKALLARSFPDATALAPDYTLQLIRCSCHSGAPRKAGNCSCLRNQLTHTVFGACEGSRLSYNSYTEHTNDGDDDLHMFGDADVDFTANWSLPLWRIPSMNYYHILMLWRAQMIVVKQCIISLFLNENLVLWVYSVMWHSKSPGKMYPQHSVKNSIANTIHQRKILSVFSYYCGHRIDVKTFNTVLRPLDHS